MTIVIVACVAFGLWLFIARSSRDLFPERLQWLQFEGLNRLSPLLLGLVWGAYGFLHLIHPDGALHQMPAFLGSLRPLLFAASGALEIALGLLVISRQFRRRALFAQLVLLGALTPFVVFLLVDDRAVVDLLGRTLPLGASRFVIVLHNLLLFVWIYREYTQTSGTESAPTERGGWGLSPVVIVAVTMLAANAAGFAAIAIGPWYSGLPHLWAMGCLAGGALVGFIFGVPRWVQAAGTVERARYEPNTNIEQLSDWLTKILIGVGLVEIHELGNVIASAAEIFARGAMPRPGRGTNQEEAQAFATGIIVYFVIAGIIQGFLLTRMFLTRAWQQAHVHHEI